MKPQSTLSVLTNTLLTILAFSSQVVGQEDGQAPLFRYSMSEDPEATHRIAIIGAGAAGSSAAFHLAKDYNDSNILANLQIDIFETNPYVGGRTTTIKALNDPRYPTELGASIFVKVNHILYDLHREFNLSTRDRLYESTGSLYDLGIWDGSSFLFTTANDDNDGWKGRWRGYWDIAKLLWKYGLSPIRTQRAKNSVVASFLKWYDEYFPITSLTNFAAAVGLAEYTGMTGEAALSKHWVSEQFAHEIVQSSTRVNYAQNLNSIHGLETMVCMAIEGAMAVDGGNWQIFNEAIKRSNAQLHLNTTVTEVSKTEHGTYRIHTTNTTASTIHHSTTQYDTVILAAPYQFANITFTPPLPPATLPDKIDYVTLHVTLFTSPYRPSPAFFGLDTQDQVPDSILTTLPLRPNLKQTPATNPPRGPAAVGPSKFWSLSTLRVLNPSTDPFSKRISDEDFIATSKLYSDLAAPEAQKQYLYKIFSPGPVTAAHLSELFRFNHTISRGGSGDGDEVSDAEPISALPKHLVPWHYIKTWHSYPYLPPRTNFSSLILDSASADGVARLNRRVSADVPFEDASGVYYTSGVESFISTMETSALMGKNVARLIINALMDGIYTGDEL